MFPVMELVCINGKLCNFVTQSICADLGVAKDLTDTLMQTSVLCLTDRSVTLHCMQGDTQRRNNFTM